MMNSFFCVLLILSLLNISRNTGAEEWSTPEALRAFGKPGDTVRNANASERKKSAPFIKYKSKNNKKLGDGIKKQQVVVTGYAKTFPEKTTSGTDQRPSESTYEIPLHQQQTRYSHHPKNNTSYSSISNSYTDHPDGTSSYSMPGSPYTYHPDGTSSYSMPGSPYTYHPDGTSSYSMPGSPYTYHPDGTSSYSMPGSPYTYHPDGSYTYSPK